MDWKIFFFASYEMTISIIFSLLTIFITKRIIDKMIIGRSSNYGDYKDNLAMTLFVGAIIISVLILVNSSILPAVDTLRVIVLARDEISFNTVLISFFYFLLYYAITIFFSILILLSALGVFFRATIHVDEMLEIRNKNIAVSVITSMVILGIALFVRPALNRFVASLVHYEQFENAGKSDFGASAPQDTTNMVVPLKPMEVK